MNKLILDELRHLILRKFEIRNISPSDCQHIALEITRKTKKNISTTTIKRVFGFATANHQFSKFTINTLILFFEDDDASTLTYFLENEGNLANKDISNYLSIKAKVISNNTLDKIIEDCTIPFDQTIARKFAEYDFENFYNSTYSFTAFIAQSGYGKSVLLGHLVYNNFLKKNAKYEQDIILFVHADRFFNINEDFLDIEKQIFSLLDIETEQPIATYFNKIYDFTGKKLILIVDSLYMLCKEKGVKRKIFDGIIEFLVKIEDCKAIKFVFSSRTYIWRRFFENMKYSAFLKSKWFSGSYYQPLAQSNVPVLSVPEIDKLLGKININKDVLPTSIKSELKLPYNYSFFYQLKDEYDIKSSIITFEITLKYINRKLLGTSLAEEKEMVCRHLILLSSYGKNGELVNKSDFLNEFYRFKNAYMQLIIEGILTDEKHQVNEVYVEYIKFTHRNIFEYYLFKTLWEDKDQQIDKIFITPNTTLLKSFNTIKWIIFCSIKQNQYNNLECIFNLTLEAKEFTSLLSFITDNISHKITSDPKIIEELSLPSFETAFLNKLPYLDFLDPAFVSIINLLLKLTKNPNAQAYYHNILLLHDCLRFSLLRLKSRIITLKELAKTNNPISTNTLTFANYLYRRFTENEASVNSNRSIFYETKVTDDLQHKELDEILSQLNLIIANWTFEYKNELLYELIYKQYLKSDQLKKYGALSNYLLNILRLDNLVNNIGTKSKQLEHILAYRTINNINSSTFSNALNYLVRIQSHINFGNYQCALSISEEAISFFKQNNYKAFEIKLYQMSIKIYNDLEDAEKIDEYKYLVINSLAMKSL